MPNNKQVPVLRVMGFHTNRNRSVYIDPIKGIINGGSISHVSMQFLLPNNPTNWELFLQQIAHHTQIPYSKVLIQPETGNRIISEYVSFWPKKQIMDFGSTISALLSHQHDSFISGLGSPMHYSPDALKRFDLKPLKETLAPRIPLLNKIFTYSVDMPPFLMVHEGMAQGLIKNNLKLQSKSEAEITKITAKVMQMLHIYGEKYRAWVEAYVAEQNASHKMFSKQAKLNKLKWDTILAQAEFRDYLFTLKTSTKDILYTKYDLSDQEFTEVLEQFMSFGRTETDVIDIPLLKGFDIEAGLKLIKDLAVAPKKYQYNLWGFNCATVVLMVCQAMTKDCENHELKRCFDYPWYVKYLGLPVSPAMVMQQVAQARKIIDKQHENEIIANPRASTNSSSSESTVKPHPCLNNKPSLFTACFNSKNETLEMVPSSKIKLSKNT